LNRTAKSAWLKKEQWSKGIFGHVMHSLMVDRANIHSNSFQWEQTVKFVLTVLNIEGQNLKWNMKDRSAILRLGQRKESFAVQTFWRTSWLFSQPAQYNYLDDQLEERSGNKIMHS